MGLVVSLNPKQFWSRNAMKLIIFLKKEGSRDDFKKGG